MIVDRSPTGILESQLRPRDSSCTHSNWASAGVQRNRGVVFQGQSHYHWWCRALVAPIPQTDSGTSDEPRSWIDQGWLPLVKVPPQTRGSTEEGPVRSWRAQVEVYPCWNRGLHLLPACEARGRNNRRPPCSSIPRRAAAQTDIGCAARTTTRERSRVTHRTRSSPPLVAALPRWLCRMRPFRGFRS